MEIVGYLGFAILFTIAFSGMIGGLVWAAVSDGADERRFRARAARPPVGV